MKRFNNKYDFAVNGAEPAYKNPLHVGFPNVGDKAYFSQKVEEMFDNNWYTNNGPFVQEFEHQVENYLGVKNCIAMCNGTIALEIAIRSLNLRGEVIVPSYTFIATAHALLWQEITPVFADIDPLTHLISPDSVRSLITPKTTGILGVHLWGRGIFHNDLLQIAEEHNLKLLFDAAHAFGCSINRKMIGNFGSCEVFSFHATKFFNTFEGGAIVTNDDTLAKKIRLMRNFGFEGYDNVIHPGTNGKMTEICAAMGLTNFKDIDSLINFNQQNYELYKNYLKGIDGIRLLPFNENEDNNFQYIVLEIDDDFTVSRDEIVSILHAENILVRKYFWPGCHEMKPYRELFPLAKFALPNTKVISEKVIVLPTGKSIQANDIKIIADIIKNAYLAFG